MMEEELGSDFGSKYGCLFSAGIGRKPWPSTLLAAQAAFYAVLPSEHLKQEIAGGSEKQRPLLPGPGDAERQPPRG